MDSPFESEQGKEDIRHIVEDIIADWDDWIVNPQARLNLVTIALEQAGQDSDSLMYKRARRHVPYHGTASDASHALTEMLITYTGVQGRLPFFNKLLDVFENSIDTKDIHNHKLVEEVQRFRSQYKV